LNETATAKMSTSAWALVGANVLPLLGVLFLGWDLRSLLVIYWAESGVIGVYNLIQMGRVGGLLAIPLGAFFTVHYGIFMFVHLVFIVVLSVPGGFQSLQGTNYAPFIEIPILAADPWLWVGLAGLFFSHGVSFVKNTLSKEKPGRMMVGLLLFKPYGRIVVMHMTLIFGAFMITALGSPVFLLLSLIVLKTVADLYAHKRTHRKRDDESGGLFGKVLSRFEEV